MEFERLNVSVAQVACLFGLLTLGACDDARRPPVKDPSFNPPSVAAPPRSNADIAIRILTADHRIAMMQGQAAAARSLADLGATQSAADLLKAASTGWQPVEVDELNGLGFQEGVFLATRTALEAGQAEPGSIATAFDQLEAHLYDLETAAEGDPFAIMTFLMEMCEEAYAKGVNGSAIVSASDYQSAYGHALTVQRMAMRLDSEDIEDLLLELRMLLMMWPDEGPSASAIPAPEYTVVAQIGRVKFSLALLQ